MTASTRDLQFALHEVLGIEAHYQRLFGEDAPTREFIDTIIDEAARFCEGELAPLNRSGDEIHACSVTSIKSRLGSTSCS